MLILARHAGQTALEIVYLNYAPRASKALFQILINLSLSEGKFPDAWKLANVTPIFKKDDRQSKVNYRSVSLLDSLSKITEKIVFLDSIRFYWK